MGRSITYTCDGCGAVKGESNHWYSTYHHGETGDDSAISIIAFNGSRPQHYCGENCLMKAIAAALPGLHK